MAKVPDSPYTIATRIKNFPEDYAQLDDDMGGDHNLDFKSQFDSWDDDIWANFLDKQMTKEQLATMFAQIPIGTDIGPDSDLDKQLALEVAERLGPDWAQLWYRFIVLVTKLT